MANQVYESNMQPYGQQNRQRYNPSSFYQTEPDRTWGDAFKQFFMGRPERVQQLQQFTPEQQNALSQLLQMGLGGMGQFDFAPIEEEARRGFQQNTIPSIAERFTSMGGGQRSSAFQQSLGQAGAGLEGQLAAMKQNYNLQRQPLFQQMAQMGLGNRFENVLRPRDVGFLEKSGQGLLDLIGGVGQGAAQGVGLGAGMQGSAQLMNKILPLLGAL